MKIITFLLIGLIFVNCKPKEELATNDQVLKRVWMLVSFKNYSKEDLINKKASIDLTDSKFASANMGCNAISSSYEISSNSKIKFFDGIRTKMACLEMALENDFLEFLPKINYYKIEGHKLVLTSSSGQQIECIAQDWD